MHSYIRERVGRRCADSLSGAVPVGGNFVSERMQTVRLSLSRFDRSTVVALIGTLIFGLGLFVLLAWFLHKESLIVILPHSASMKFNTALGFALSGAALLLFARPRWSVWPARIVALLGALTLVEYLAGIRLGIDELVVKDFVPTLTTYPGRMAPQTALCFVLFGVGLMIALAGSEREKSWPWLNLIGSMVSIAGLSTLWGYLFNLPYAYAWGTDAGTAVHTALGFVLLGAGLLVMVARRENVLLPVVIVLVFGVTVSLQVYYVLTSQQEAELKERFTFDSRDRASMIEQQFKEDHDAVQSLAALYAASPRIDRKEFQIMAGRLLDANPSLFALEWVPAVGDDERARYEAGVRSEGVPGYEIKEADEEGRLVRAPRRARYFPIHYVEPLARRGYLLGLDLGAMAGRADALQEAQNTSHMIVSEPFEWRQLRDHSSGSAGPAAVTDESGLSYLAVTPVFRSSPGAPSDRQPAIGFVVGVFRVADIVQAALSTLRPEGIDIYLYDLSAPADRQLLYSWLSPIRRIGTDRYRSVRYEDASTLKGLVYTRESTALGRTRGMLFIPTASYLDSVKTPVPAVMATGVGGTALLFVVLVSARFRRTSVIEREVQERTEALMREVTERKKAEKTAYANERRYAQFLDEAPDPIITLDGLGCVQSMNPAAESYLGYTRDELTGKHFAQAGLVSAASVPKAIEEFASVMFKGVRPAFELEVVRKDGELLVFEVHAKRLRRDGGATEVQIIFRDITARKRNELLQSLQYEAGRIIGETEELEQAVPKMLEIICTAMRWDLGQMWRIDSTGSMGQAGPAVPPGQTVPVLRKVGAWARRGPNYAEFLSSSDAMTYLPGVGLPGRVWKYNSVTWIPDVVRDPDFSRASEAGRARLHGAVAFPIRSGGEVAGVVEFYSRKIEQPDANLLQMLDLVGARLGDLILRKEVELHKAEAVRLRSEFVSIVSHELRTPLTVIKGGIDVVMDEVVGPVNAEQKDVLATVKSNVDRLSRLINDVLDYQKLEAGRMKFALTAQEIDAIVNGVVRQFLPEADKKGLQLASRISEKSLKVLCDKDKITQVLYNLLGNAVKFTEHGAVAVSVERLDGRCVRVSVKDDGVGIRAEDRHKLFQSFSQLERDGDRKTGGTGLGLSISKKIIEGHNGEIGVESEYGHGATFYFTLPMAA